MNDAVIITGHNNGLGLALAQAWLACDADVFGVSRNHSILAKQPALGGTFREKILDLSHPATVLLWLRSQGFRQFCQNARRLWLFNNAATLLPDYPIGQQNNAALVRAINLNVTAPLLFSDAVARYACAGRQVNIVHISSGAGQTPYQGWSVYGASKAALNQHAQVCRLEHAHIQVVSIAPGVIDTNMQRHIRAHTDFVEQEKFVRLKEEGKLQSAEETAFKLINYCLSEAFGENAYVDLRQLEA